MDKQYHYEHDVRVTFCMTNAEGNVNHHEYARLFGKVRELFALDCIPNFQVEAGREYLLKTRNASYDYHRDFYFGDVIRIRLRIEALNHASLVLAGIYVNTATGEVHARGRQEIVYTDMNGKPRRFPEEMRKLMEPLCS
ncbi:MAG: thioesterase family protein [Deltaproteobacteria bacterium]|nr:thioesterase family protein [Deltaproteobacteria bacterium]